MFTIDLTDVRVRCWRLGFEGPARLDQTPHNAPVFARRRQKILSRIARKQREFTERIARFRALTNSQQICGNVHDKE